jgi:hypothetical protein
MQPYRAEGCGRMSLLLFLTHNIRYYNIKPADDQRVTSYCDRSSFLEAEETFHNRDVDPSSWYLKADHDVIMTLSAVKKQLPFQRVSCTYAVTKMKNVTSLTSPDQNNSTY